MGFFGLILGLHVFGFDLLNIANEGKVVFVASADAAEEVVRICRGNRLDVVQVAMRASCNNCGKTFDFDVYSPGCDKCRGKDIRFEPDAPLMLEEIEFEDDV